MADPIPNGVCAAVPVVVDNLLSVTGRVLEFPGIRKYLMGLTRLRDSLYEIEEILPFLEDAERRQATDVSVSVWLNNLADAVYGADAVLDEMDYEYLRLEVEDEYETKNSKTRFCFGCFDAAKTGEEIQSRMAPEINRVSAELKSVADAVRSLGLRMRVSTASSVFFEGRRETDTLSLETDNLVGRQDDVSESDNLLGRQDDVSKLVRMLINAPSDNTVSVIPIVGMGGTGKTFLARSIFNNPSVGSHFSARIWMVPPDDFDATRIFIRMLKALGVYIGEDVEPPDVIAQLHTSLARQRYLLVLDDLWSEDRRAWDRFIHVLEHISPTKGNAILVTTRLHHVAAVIVSPHRQPYHVRLLADEECWSIIKASAFSNQQVPAKFESIGKDIAYKCRGMPLAATMIGASLRGKTVYEWQLIRESIGNSRETEVDSVKVVLKLSYDSLPRPLKICFFYCSVFPKDSTLDREELVQLWMAQGFLRCSSESSMESTGNLYFKELLDRSLFQQALVDKLGNVVSCKMHDLLHDLACLISKSQSYIGLDNLTVDEIPKVRYVAVESLQEGRKGIRQENASNVRSLFCKANITNNVLPRFDSLRSLILREAYIKELPTSVDKLIRLRYLDASYNPIERFPHSVCKLYHLETLRIFTLNLQELPEKLHNLISLRHLYFDAPQIEMPPHIGRLTCLQTLSSFNVSDKEGCRIDELGHLKNLGGKLTIRNLELVKDKEEAMIADLIRKENIYKLKFIWSTSRESNNNDQNVLDGLQPHQNLKSLKIEGFRGQNFPSWTINMAMHDLVQIKITHCDSCENIPMLGHLPLLKYLEFDGLTSLTSIDTSFYGDGNSSSQERRVYFRSLERLVLKKMFNLGDWKKPAIFPEEECGLLLFPRLEYLELNGCHQLMDAPTTFPSLRNLYFRSVKNDSLLGKVFIDRLNCLTKLHIACANEITYLPDQLFYDNDKLQELSIYSCLKLKELPKGLHRLKSIQKLEIGDCPGLQSIPYPSGVEGLTSLKHAKISCCPGLTSLPSEMFKSCTSLQSLMIGGLANLTSLPLEKWEMDYLVSLKLYKCSKMMSSMESIGRLHRLKELSIGQFSESVDISSFPGMRHLNLLRTLTLYGWPSHDSLPLELMHLTSLRNLVLYDWGMTALPVWLGSLSSLQELELRRCEKLQQMPPEEVMGRLTTLKKLYIQDCPELEERCQPTHPDSQSNKISHIPVVEIGTRSIRFHPLFLSRNN